MALSDFFSASKSFLSVFDIFFYDATGKERPFWQKIVLSALLGSLAIVAYTPHSFSVLGGLIPLTLSLSGFATLLFQEKTFKKAFYISLSFFFFYYFSTLYWVGHAFAVVGLGWLSPLAYGGLPLALSILPIAASVLTWRYTQTLSKTARALALVAALTITFLLQMLGSFAFPWVLPGYVLPLELQQMAAFIGIEGLSFLVLFISFTLFVRTWGYTFFSTAILVGLALCGYLRLAHDTVLTPYNFRIIQPSIQQTAKWDPEQTQRHLQLQGLLSQLDAEKPVQAILWPEAAVTFDFSKYPEIQKMLGNAAPQGGYVFLGSVREDGDSPRNSLVALNDKGEIQALYDKKHLVPFGEYIPFRFLFPGVNKITHGAKDFVPGTRDNIIAIKNVPPFRPLICYEAIFSREIFSPKDKASKTPAQWLLNLTNDAWYGDSYGPHQHLGNVRVRAIEQGLPLVRVANNGISAVIDPYGRILHKLDLNDIGIIDFSLPEAIAPTFYSLHGHWVVPCLFALSLMIFIALYSLRQTSLFKKK